MAVVGTCTNPQCYASENAQCAEGEDYPQNCPHWKPVPDAPAANRNTNGGPEAAPDGRWVTFAWSGNSMGRDDIMYVASRQRPKVIALVGPHNSGKTTFLAMVYLLIRRGKGLEIGKFAGSYSLGGWEKLAGYFTWSGDREPTFPPHAAASDGRRPGMLHLSFRGAASQRHETLWTDAPGEWFRLWAIDADDPDAEGARWTQRHADAFILFADSEALSGPERGLESERLLLLIERLGASVANRPVALVWAKSDHPVAVPQLIRERIVAACAKRFAIRDTFSIHVPEKEPDEGNMVEFLRLLNWVLLTVPSPAGTREPPIVAPDDPFLAFRGKD